MTQSKTLTIQRPMSRVGKEIGIAIVGSCFLAILSQIAIPLPFTIVPLTLQTFAIFMLGGLLGPKRASYSVLAYLSQACTGLPVLAGGIANPLWILDPKAGFLISFIAAAFLIAKLIQKGPKNNFLYLLFSLTMGQIAIYGIGMLWLSFYVGPTKAFLFGVVPFLAGAVLKITAAALVIKGFRVITKESS